MEKERLEGRPQGEMKQEKTQDVHLQRAVAVMEDLTTQLGWVSRRRLEQELSRFGLTVPQFITLRCIEESVGGCSMTELAASSFQVSATMTGIVDRLVERGLVCRERDPHDRRALSVQIMDEGSQLLERVSAHKRVWVREFVKSLTPSERKQMIDFTQRYLAMMTETIGLD